MTDMHYLKVLAKEDLDLTVRVYIENDCIETNPAASSWDFFLLVLTDPAEHWQRLDAPILAAAYPPPHPDDADYFEEEGDFGDPDYRQQLAPRFISRVVELGAHNFPAATNAMLGNVYRQPSQYDELPYTDYRLTVTDARWTQHLKPGDEWGSTICEFNDF